MVGYNMGDTFLQIFSHHMAVGALEFVIHFCKLQILEPERCGIYQYRCDA